MNQYTYHTTVLNADGDFRRMIKPSALFRYVEQAAADHARAYGMDDAFFKAHHTAFLVGKQAAQITRMPLRAEKLTFLTACEPCKKGSMKRLTRILDEAGKECALIDSRWIMVDTDHECILRQLSWHTPGYWNEDLDGELPQLVHKAKELTCAGSRTASYSLCDLNGHVNNACYLDIACDALPLEVVKGGPLKFVSVKYHREIPLGSQVEALCASPPSNTTARSPWGPRWWCPMPRRRMAGMWWAAAKSTPRLNATWNLQNKSRKITIMLQNLRKRSCKTETKELQYGYRKR